MPATISLHKIRHPQHTLMSMEWEKFRLAFEGGQFFKTKYLEKFSAREDDTDFATRKRVSHVPAHAKAAILDIRNAIFKRMVDITRKDGPESYTQAVTGLSHGVDGKGNSMNSFLGQVILPELLVLGRVGVYVDKPQMLEQQVSLADARKHKPYLYHYQAEDIFSWHYNSINKLDVVLLRDHDFTTDEGTGLINGEVENFRLLKLIEIDGKPQVLLKRFGLSQKGAGVSSPQPPINVVTGSLNVIDEIILDLPEIPFVLLELETSLMTDVADYQISLLNLASSDVNYALKSNFPFYTEQYHPASDLSHLRQADTTGTAVDGASANARQAKTGVAQGRRYPMGTERPAFIHPSAEPLKASMALQAELRQEIRQLVNLSLTNLGSTRASAESKDRDNQGLEGGLANIGLELEFGERNIGRIWWLYENAAGGEVTVKYPDNYSMRTDTDRRKEAEELQKISPTVPSPTFQKQTTKDIITIMQGHKVSLAELQTMHAEIDKAVVIITDPEIIRSDHEAGFVGDELASRLRGYPKGESERAAKDHAERAARIVVAQTAQARGVPALGNNPAEGSDERAAANDTNLEMSEADRTRGNA